MDERKEYSGDECVVLPGNYLNSIEAVADLYSDQLEAAANNFEIGQLSRRGGYFRRAVLVSVIWALSGLWTVCS